jgi:glycyl-tRNA synthetase beta chain
VDAPPTRQQLGAAAITWAAVSLADKLDSVVGMFSVGELATGSRDPLGLRRQAQGVVKILVDLPELTGMEARTMLGPLLNQAGQRFPGYGDAQQHVFAYMADRVTYLLEQRGFDARTVRAVMHAGEDSLSPLTARRKAEALAQMSGSESLMGVATLLKRAKNITKGVTRIFLEDVRERLKEPAERALESELSARMAAITAAKARVDYHEAFLQIAQLQPTVARFFDDVLVMAPDEHVRTARLALVTTLRDTILDLADISEMAPETQS